MKPSQPPAIHRRDAPKAAPTWLLTALVVAASTAPAAARRERLELVHRPIELPGAPAQVLSADLDDDGRRDLVVLVAYTEWDQLSIEESTEMAGIEGLVEVMTIVPTLIDRRELFVFLGDVDGYRPAGPPLPVDRSLLALAAGPPGLPVVALRDDGAAALILDESGAIGFRPLIADRPVLAGAGSFLPRLELIHDLDGDGRGDLLLPAADGASVYLADGNGFRTPAAARLALPTDRRVKTRLVRHYPVPEVRDVDGDGQTDLLFADDRHGWRRFHVLRNRGGGRFAPAVAPLGDEGPVVDPYERYENRGEDDEEPVPTVVHFGDLDGDGRAEYVTQLLLSDEDAGMRKSIREAKNPPSRIFLHRSLSDLTMAAEPYQQVRLTGYAFYGTDDGGNEGEIRLPGGFQDLDGDGRLDLVTLTLDFSVLQAVRVLAARSISIGLDFHIWCQNDEGGFRPVSGLDLSGRFRLNLDNFRIGHLSQFAGDFDGDGRADFLQMGRGEKVTLHRGGDGCSYAPKPDYEIRLAAAPRDLALVRVEDFDGDALTDLLVVQPQKVSEPGVTPPVRLDLYLSGDLDTDGRGGP